jgi:hypothetical protein
MSKTQFDVEKLRSLRNTLTSGMTFKSYRKFCEHFEIEPTGGRTKTSIMEELSIHCEWEQVGNSICVIELKPYDPEQVLKIAAKDLKSELYPPCGYLLLNYLIKKRNCIPDEKYYYSTKRGIMSQMFICNDNYSSISATQSLEEISKKDHESSAFCRKTEAHLYQIVDRITDWLKRMELVTYSEVYMVKFTGKIPREATAEETININDYYDVIEDKYRLTKKEIKSSWHKKEIYNEFKEILGYAHYIAIKFHLNDELVSNADKLKRSAKLNDNCGYEVNSLMCNKISEVVRKFINKKAFDTITDEKTFDISFDEFLEDFVLNGAPMKDNLKKQWRFSSDDDFIKQTIEDLVNHFIKIDYCYES